MKRIRRLRRIVFKWSLRPPKSTPLTFEPPCISRPLIVVVKDSGCSWISFWNSIQVLSWGTIKQSRYLIKEKVRLKLVHWMLSNGYLHVVFIVPLLDLLNLHCQCRESTLNRWWSWHTPWVLDFFTFKLEYGGWPILIWPNPRCKIGSKAEPMTRLSCFVLIKIGSLLLHAGFVLELQTVIWQINNVWSFYKSRDVINFDRILALQEIRTVTCTTSLSSITMTFLVCSTMALASLARKNSLGFPSLASVSSLDTKAPLLFSSPHSCSSIQFSSMMFEKKI